MIITGKRIRNLNRHFAPVRRGQKIIISLPQIERFQRKLLDIGFSQSLSAGQTILPPPTFGPVSAFNADGRYQVHRDQPKETAYRTVEWKWKEWHGPYDQVEQSRIIDVPYPRYPRTFIAPPSVEITISATTNGSKILTTTPVEHVPKNDGLIVHRINLFLEIFGECEVCTEQLDQIIAGTLRRLNWHVLPPGRRPWSQLKGDIDPIIRSAPAGNQPVIRFRLETVNSYQPEFVAVGQHGFHGYVVFGFPKKQCFILECTRTGNATYALGNRWEDISQRSKAEILNENLHLARFIHRVESWQTQLQAFMNDR